MIDEINQILRTHGDHYTTGNQYNTTEYTDWIPVVKTNLKAMKTTGQNQLRSEAKPKVSASVCSGRSPTQAQRIPWIAFRPLGGRGNRGLSAREGVYVNFLFSEDGSFSRLVVGISTALIENTAEEISKHTRKLRDVQSERIIEIKGQFNGRIHESDFDWETNSNDGKFWGIACPYSLNYPVGSTLTSQEILDDIVGMMDLYEEIATAMMPEDIDAVIANIQKNLEKSSKNPVGREADLGVMDYAWMLKNYSIITYDFDPIAKSKTLGYKREEWEWLVHHCDFLRLKDSILEWNKPSLSNLESVESAIFCHRHVILEGPPGVGKTHFLKTLLESGKFNYHTMLTFHASTEYNDFIGGLKPVISTQKVVSPAGMGGMFRVRSKPVLELKAVKGHFLEALGQTNKGKVLIWIDELNRGNVAKIFGELIGLIGTDKPGSPTIRNADLPDDVLNLDAVNLDNLYIVGTINTADRSISHLDAAIRRRFKFVRMKPDYTLSQISDIMESDDGKCFKLINESLRKKIGSDGELGHSYLFELKENPGARELIWRYSILPNIADLLIREDSKDLLSEINKNIPADIHYELKKHGTGFSSHIEVTRKTETTGGEEE
jgi:hypothetical protein